MADGRAFFLRGGITRKNHPERDPAWEAKTVKNILLTGATGLVGTHLLPLLAERARVLCLGRHKGPDLKNVRWIETDLSDDLPVRELPSQVDAVVYLAQSRRFRNFPEDASDIFAVNTKTPFLLANWAQKSQVRTFIYASTGGVYAPASAPLDEDAALLSREEMGFYPASKLAAEHVLAAYSSCFNVGILRPFFIYGPGQSEDMLVPRLIDSLRTQKPIYLVNGQGFQLNPIYVSDFCDAVLRALELERSATVNVAGPEILSLRQMVEIAAETLGTTPLFESVTTGVGGDMASSTSLQKVLLGEPTVTVREGIGMVLKVS